METKKIIIGLTGPISGGKGIVADYLKEKGFFYSSTSDRVREELKERGIEITRENLQKVADELRKEFGPNVLASRTYDKVVNQKISCSVIDSIRGEAEVDFLKQKPNFYFIGVTAPRKLRYKRMVERNRESDPISWEDFVKVDKADFKSGKGKFGRNMKACLKKVDILIENTGTLEEIKDKIEKCLKKFF